MGSSSSSSKESSRNTPKILLEARKLATVVSNSPQFNKASVVVSNVTKTAKQKSEVFAQLAKEKSEVFAHLAKEKSEVFINTAKEKSSEAIYNASILVDQAKDKVKTTSFNNQIDEKDIVWVQGPVQYIHEYQQRKAQQTHHDQIQQEQNEEILKQHVEQTRNSWASMNIPAYMQHEYAALSQIERFTYVIVGFGVAAGYCAKQLSELGVKGHGSVCLIGEEPTYAYERPALSKAYLFPPNGSKEALRLPKFHCGVAQGLPSQGEEFYNQLEYTCFLNHRVTYVDAKNHYIKCSNSKQVGFEKLIICTGSESNHLARLPGDDLTNIFYLRREHEFSYLIEHLLQFKQRRAAAILGSGYLGLEVATSLCGWGFNEVHLIFPGDYLFQRHHGWTKAFRERLEEEIKKRSGGRLKLYPQQTIQMMVPNYKDDGEEQNIGGVVLEDGTVLDAQLLICCVGAKPTGRELFGSLNFDVKTLKCESDVFACGEVAIPECGVEAARAMGRFVAQQAFNEVNHKEEKESEENHQTVFSITPFHYSRLFEFSDNPLIWYEIGTIEEKKMKLVSFIDSSHFLFLLYGSLR